MEKKKEKKKDSVPFQVNAFDKNVPGVTCSLSNKDCFQLLLACNWT